MFDLKNYHKATSVDEAIQLLEANPESRLIAGGTDILIKLREGKRGYADLIDIHELTELRYLKLDGDGSLLIGAGIHFTEIIDSELVQQEIPMLCDAAGSVGGPQIRNVATIGGNICNGVTSADSAMGLFALNTLLQLKGPGGFREVPIEKFYLGPGRVDLHRGEVLLGFKVTPDNYKSFSGYYYKYAMREAMDIATIGCAVNLKVENGKLLDYRIAYGVAGPVPLRCPEAEGFAVGREITPDLVESIAEKVSEDVNPRTSWRASRDFRMNIIKELAKRATMTALQRAGEVKND